MERVVNDKFSNDYFHFNSFLASRDLSSAYKPLQTVLNQTKRGSWSGSFSFDIRIWIKASRRQNKKTWKITHRALTPLFGNGAGAHGIGKIFGVLTKIEKFDIILMYDVSIARLIPARSKCYYILLFCEILICNNMFCIYIIWNKGGEAKKKKKKFFSLGGGGQIGNFCLEFGKKHTFWHWEWGRISAPKLGDREPWPSMQRRSGWSILVQIGWFLVNLQGFS